MENDTLPTPEVLVPLDRARTPQDQQVGYQYYLQNEYMITDISDRFDFAFHLVKYYYESELSKGYTIMIDYDVYPKVEMEMDGIHTVVKLDDRILAYIYTTMIERDMGPDKDTQLSWRPYQEGYFIGFGGNWAFSCLWPGELEDAGVDLYTLKDILRTIEVTVLWDGGSETVSLTYPHEMEFALNEEMWYPPDY